MAAPTLSMSAPTTGFTDEVMLFDGIASSGICTTPQSDGSASVLMDYGDGFTSYLIRSGHIYRTAGTYSPVLKAWSCAGELATLNLSNVVVTDIPAATGGGIQTLTDTGNVTTNATNLQNAINTAAGANSVEQEILLPTGFIAAGPVLMTVPTGGSKYITIRWSNLSTLPRKKRITDAVATNLPVITTPSSTVETGLRTPTPAADPPSHHYRVQGISFRKSVETGTPPPSLLNWGTDSGGGQTTFVKYPHHFIADRCNFTGGTSTTSRLINAIRVYGDYVSIVDSNLVEVKGFSGDIDAAAISYTIGRGPAAFWNNSLSATGENFNAAGGNEINTATISAPTTTSCTLSSVTNLSVDTNIALPVSGVYSAGQSTIVRSVSGFNITYDAVLVTPTNGGTAEWTQSPAFVEFRQNYFWKDLAWENGGPSWNGQDYIIKNLYEMKFGKWITMRGNVFRYNWSEEQFYAFALTVNSGGGSAAAFTLRDIDWTDNILWDSNAGFNITANAVTGIISSRAKNYYIYNNLFINVGDNWRSSLDDAAFIIQRGTDAAAPFVGFHFVHNTIDNGTPINTDGRITDFGSDGGAVESYMFNNVHQFCGLGYWSQHGGNFTQALIDRFPPGTETNVNKNLILNASFGTWPAGFIHQSATWASAVFTDYANGDYNLQSGSLGKGAALDGTDCGVNVTALRTAVGASSDSFKTATIKAVTGDWTGTATVTLCRWDTTPTCQAV